MLQHIIATIKNCKILFIINKYLSAPSPLASYKKESVEMFVYLLRGSGKPCIK